MKKYIKILFAIFIGITFSVSFESCYAGMRGAPGKQMGAGWDSGKRRHHKPATAKSPRRRSKY
ncbi:MAG: hypothetical protein Kow0079_11050 [Vicingaceae bacterium]|jgi:hypothetical protein